MPKNEKHIQQKRKNYALLAVLAVLVMILFFVSFIRVEVNL